MPGKRLYIYTFDVLLMAKIYYKGGKFMKDALKQIEIILIDM